jgi:hypothetical protein
MSKKQKEKSMPPTADDETGLDEAVAAALEKTEGTSDARALADAEERAQAQKLAELNALDVQVQSKPVEDLTELPMVTILERGRDTLEEAMRQNQRKMQEAATAYVPPPRTEAQNSRLQEELEAGRKAQARAEEQLRAQRELAARTQPDPREGTSTPVHRSGLMVPNPKGGSGVYAPTAGL